MPYQLDIDKIPEDPLSKSQGNDPSFTKDVQQAAEEGDSTTKNSKKDSEPETKEKEKEKKNNNFYSYNPPPVQEEIKIVEEKKEDKNNSNNKTKDKNQKHHNKPKEIIIEPNEADLKDIVFDEEIQEIQEIKDIPDNPMKDKKKSRKKQRREEIEIIESDKDDDDEDYEDKDDEDYVNEIEMAEQRAEEKALEKKKEKKEKEKKEKMNKKLEKIEKIEQKYLESQRQLENKNTTQFPVSQPKEEKKPEEKEVKQEIPVERKFGKGKEEPDITVQNFEKEIMKKIKAEAKKNEGNNNADKDKKKDTKPKQKLEDRLKVEDGEGLTKDETIIQYLIESLDTSNISELISKLAPPNDSKKKYKKNKKSLFQVTDANGKKIKSPPNPQLPDAPNQPKPKKKIRQRWKDPAMIDTKNIFNGILLTSLMKQYGYDAIAEAIVKTKNTTEEYEKNDLDEFVECILKTTSYNSLIHSLIQCKSKMEEENNEKKKEEPEGLDAQINNYLNYKIKERKEKDDQTKDIDIIVSANNNNITKREKSEDSIHYTRRKRKRKEKSDDDEEEEDEEVILLDEPNQYSLRNPPKQLPPNDVDIVIDQEEENNNNNKTADGNYEINLGEPEKEPFNPYRIEKKKIFTESQKIMKERKFGMHYHLGDDGHIYKYYHQHLKDGDKVVYECSDPVCKSKGIYYMNEKKFEVISNHVGYWSHKVLLRTLRKDKFFDLMKNKGYKDMHLSRANGLNIEWAM